jgi:hypothetical protein
VKQRLSTRDAAKKLGKSLMTVQRNIANGNIDAPPLVAVGGVTVRLWSDRDIEKARKALAGIKLGRKPKAK